MKTRHIRRATSQGTKQDGFSILEALVASFIMIVGIVGLMALFAVAAVKNAGQGDQATRCTEYAQDKMEQLLALKYTDAASNVVGATTQSTGGVGIACVTPSCGGINPASPVTNYADWVSWNGNQEVIQNTSTTGTVMYVREWQITNNVVACTNNCTMTITVKVTAQFNGFSAGQNSAVAPSTTLIAVKGQY